MKKKIKIIQKYKIDDEYDDIAIEIIDEDGELHFFAKSVTYKKLEV